MGPENRQHYRWDLNRVRQELDRVLSLAFEQVWELSQQKKVSLRTAAYIVGIERVGRDRSGRNHLMSTAINPDARHIWCRCFAA